MKDSSEEQYTITREPIEKGCDVYYILEQDSKQLFKIKGKTLYKLYALFGDVEKLKDALYVADQGTDLPKAATDYFVEETYKMFTLKRLERKNSLFAKPYKDHETNMKDANEEHYTINMQTHYTIQYKNKTDTWVGDDGKTRYHLTLENAKTAMENAFKNEHISRIDEATIIEWKKTPVLVKKNFKPVIESKTTFDVEVYDRTENMRGWRVVEYSFETFKMAQDYIKVHTQDPLYSDNYRIIQRDITVKTSVV
jgi:hypothetical protein